MTTTRRGFITGCSAAVAAYAGTSFNTLAFGDPLGSNEEILVSVFLRGGMDGLSMICPVAGDDRGHYENARPNLALPLTGPDRAISLPGGQFGLHRAADTWDGEMPPATFHELFQADKVSLVLAAGMHTDNRSHFDSMGFMELGTPGSLSTPTGWLTRHMQTASNVPDDLIIPALAVGDAAQDAFRGSLDALNMDDPDDFSLNVGPSQWRDAQRVALRNLYGGSTWLQSSGTRTLDALDIIEIHAGDGNVPQNGAVYPSGSFGNHLQTIAAMVKLDLGLRVATIDYGGWDTHNSQGSDGGGTFASKVQELCLGLSALYTDLDGSGQNNYADRLTIVVMSEFGRRLAENADEGTDHGHGNMMIVLSGNATGGLHGSWPGLANGELYDGADLAVTTDYRRVLTEILIRRMGNTNIETIFPGYEGYQPLGVVQGNDLPIGTIFADDFESGDTSAWSTTIP